jgi:DNA polymerase (family 10)
MAKDLGIMVAVNTDAHSTQELRFIAAGINQARRAWLTKVDVLNCMSLGELLSVIDHR